MSRSIGASLVALSAVILSACGTEDRSAAPVEAPQSSVPTGDVLPLADQETGTEPSSSDDPGSPEPIIDAQQPSLATAANVETIRACISNDHSNSKSRVTLRWLGKGAVLTGNLRPTGHLFPGEQVCGEWKTEYGAMNVNIYGPDVQLSVEQSDSSPSDPNLMLRQSLDRSTFNRVCFGERGSSIPVGYSESWDNGLDLVSVVRLPDTTMNELSVSVADSLTPSADGAARQCDLAAN